MTDAIINYSTSKNILQGFYTELNKPNVIQALQETKDFAHGKTDLLLQYMVPKVMEVQGIVIQQYGLIPSDETFARVSQSLNHWENHPDTDDEYKELSRKFKEQLGSYIRQDEIDESSDEDDDVDEDSEGEEGEEQGDNGDEEVGSEIASEDENDEEEDEEEEESE